MTSISSSGRRLPFVSVILPIRNESDFIERSLGAVLNQSYPADQFEVLIADGMSTDDTRAIVSRMAAEHPSTSVTVLDNPRCIVPTGFNLALARARGEVILRVDGHTIIAGDYIEECVRALRLSRADNVGGRMDAVSETPFGRAVAIATSSRFGVGGARFHYSNKEEWVDTVYLGAWPRSVFEWNGLFDEELVRNQDDEFNYRLLKRGGRILLTPRIQSRYYARSTPRGLFRQYAQYGFWKVRVMQKHLKEMRVRQFVPPLFVATLAVLAALTPFVPVSKWLLAGVLAAYAVAALVSSVRTGDRDSWPLVLVLPLTFLMLHMSYGLGFLAGLVVFLPRWTWRARDQSYFVRGVKPSRRPSTNS
jgi:glycosyltransferase involved in cell wall biosynthesis